MNGRADIFYALVMATAAHVAVLFPGVQSVSGGRGGEEGANRITIAAMSPALTSTLRDWDRSPETAVVDGIPVPNSEFDAPFRVSPESEPVRASRPSPPISKGSGHSAPELVLIAVSPMSAPNVSDNSPKLAAKMALQPSQPTPKAAQPPTAEELSNFQTTPPVADFAPRNSQPPLPRPEKTSAPAVTSRVASGVGGTGNRGERRQHAAQESKATEKQAATSAWAAEIQRRIARHHIYPRGSRDEGRVRVAMVILPTGKLSHVSVARSSGSASLDNAALAAVKRAAPFPPAPAALKDDYYSVGQWIFFERR